MLEFLRKSAGGTVAKVFIGLLVVSFAVWGIGDIFRGFGASDLAQVGSVKIQTETFRQLYQDRLQQFSRQIGRGISPDQARALGVDRQLLGELISETTLDEKTRQMGLNVDQQTLLNRVHANPAFRGVNGNFDPARFYDTLRNAGFTEARYVDSERRLMLRQQMGRALSADTTAPAALRDALTRFETEERSVEFVTLDRKSAGEIPAPTPAEIDAYFNERKAAFRAPEFRKIVLLTITPESLAAAINVPDADVKRAYESIRDRLGAPERREVDQIVFTNADEAKAAAKRIADGTKFEDIVAERNLKPSDVSLGLVAKREILDPGVANAVFGLQPGAISDPLTGQFGTVIARVNKIEPGKEPAFDDISDTIRKDIAIQRARSALLDQHDKIEDERAGGAHLSEVAAKLGAKAVTIEVDRSGRGMDGKLVENIPGLSEIVTGAFSAQVGVEADPIELSGGNGYAWYEVASITPSRDQTLAEARDRVEARWRDDQIVRKLSERAEEIRKRLDAGDKFDAAAAGLPVQTREKVRRGATVEGLDRNALAAVFQTAQGKSGVGVAEDGVDRVVFRVTSVSTPAATNANPQRIAELNLGVQDDILVQYVLQLQNQLGIRVNEAAFRAATGGDTGN